MRSSNQYWLGEKIAFQYITWLRLSPSRISDLWYDVYSTGKRKKKSGMCSQGICGISIHSCSSIFLVSLKSIYRVWYITLFFFLQDVATLQLYRERIMGVCPWWRKKSEYKQWKNSGQYEKKNSSLFYFKKKK